MLYVPGRFAPLYSRLLLTSFGLVSVISLRTSLLDRSPLGLQVPQPHSCTYRPPQACPLDCLARHLFSPRHSSLLSSPCESFNRSNIYSNVNRRLQHNLFSGSIPTFTNSPSLLDLSDTGISGTLPASLFSYSSLVGLHLSNTALTGSLPQTMSATKLHTVYVPEPLLKLPSTLISQTHC